MRLENKGLIMFTGNKANKVALILGDCCSHPNCIHIVTRDFRVL
jgi:hypothetical protein